LFFKTQFYGNRGFTKVKAEEELKKQIAVSDNYQFDDSNKKQDSDAIAMGV